ncbi:MAG: DNA mismatch repair protein MutS, partial [Nanoarchaeota archaeon]
MAEDSPNSHSVLSFSPDQLTPGMRQYQEVKQVHPDCLVMLRMGDFYEMFYEDAITAARELEITLTARGTGEKRAPLAGVPFHALETYLARLIKKGHKVAIVEQLEDPKMAKGLVKRGLVRIVTPGTIIESSLLQEKENNYIIALTSFKDSFALACCDLSTGEFFTQSMEGMPYVLHELARLHPSECVIPQSLGVNKELKEKVKSSGCFLTTYEDHYFQLEKSRTALLEHFKMNSLQSFGLEDYPRLISAAGALLQYLLHTQRNALPHIKRVTVRSDAVTMVLDSSTLRNLELMKNLREGTMKGTLLAVLDATVTSMGGRLLRRWITEPLLQRKAIETRLNAVEELTKKVILREEMRDLLQNMYDLERLMGRINYGTATPRDVVALRHSLS